jgi:hypothetical protein
MALSLLGSATRSVPPVAERNFEQCVSPSPSGKGASRVIDCEAIGGSVGGKSRAGWAGELGQSARLGVRGVWEGENRRPHRQSLQPSQVALRSDTGIAQCWGIFTRRGGANERARREH